MWAARTHSTPASPGPTSCAEGHPRPADDNREPPALQVPLMIGTPTATYPTAPPATATAKAAGGADPQGHSPMPGTLSAASQTLLRSAGGSYGRSWSAYQAADLLERRAVERSPRLSPLVANGSVSDMAEDPLVRVEQLLREATRLLNDYRLEHDLEAARRTPITGRQLGVLVKVAQQHGESGVTQGSYAASSWRSTARTARPAHFFVSRRDAPYQPDDWKTLPDDARTRCCQVRGPAVPRRATGGKEPIRLLNDPVVTSLK